MIVTALFILPRYTESGILTAYQFLEIKFNREVRFFAALLFLVQRGLASGFNFFVPAVVLSLIIGVPVSTTILVLGLVVTIYTTLGGAEAISKTQTIQMLTMLLGLFGVFGYLIFFLSNHFTFLESLRALQFYDKLNAVDFSLSPKNRYTVWAGLSGGFFLALSYFATDQSQVQRYLTDKNPKEAQIGLLLNGIFKIPLQMLVLGSGVLLFLFYRVNPEPISFHPSGLSTLNQAQYSAFLAEYNQISQREGEVLYKFVKDSSYQEELREIGKRRVELKVEADRIVRASAGEEAKEVDYVFLTFILQNLPSLVSGLFIAAILAAALSTAASEMSALGASVVVDLYSELSPEKLSDRKSLVLIKIATVSWGALAVLFAFILSRSENMIQGINILGSLFYGVMLGMFVLGFLPKRPRPRTTILGALVAEAAVIYCHLTQEIGFLWYNAIGLLLTISLSFVFTILYNLLVFITKIRLTRS